MPKTYVILLVAALQVQMLVPDAAFAADRWVVVQPAVPGTPGISATELNLGSVQMNDLGSRVTNVRSVIGGYRMESRDEYDCVNRRTRILASAVFTPQGHLLSANGPNAAWTTKPEHLPKWFNTVCSAPITPEP